jgi:hypothetical protein
MASATDNATHLAVQAVDLPRRILHDFMLKGHPFSCP